MRSALVRAQNMEGLLNGLRPVIGKIPIMVSNRVRSTGSGAEGRFSSYTNMWAKRRANAGLQTGNKDFWFSGDMWSNYKIVDEEVTKNGVTYTLGYDAKDSRNRDHFLADIHSDNENQNILAANEEEEQALFKEISKVIGENISAILRI